MGWFKIWVSFRSSQSRWGVVSWLFSISLFFLALSPSFYSIYLSIIGGTIMLPFSPNLAFCLAVITGIIGILIGLFATFVAIYWIVTGSKDDTDKKLTETNDGVKELLRRSEPDGKSKTEHPDSNL